MMRDKGLWQTYSGPRIRQTLQIAKQVAQWYNGYDPLLNPAVDLFADAYYEPKMVVVPIILSNQEILNNEGEAQLMDVLDSYMDAAERALEDAMDAGIHSDGSANSGKQLTGLMAAIPTLNTTGIYGGINRASNSLVADQDFDAHTAFPTIGTQVNSTTIRPILNVIMTQQSRGKDYADLLLMSPEHYAAYDAATLPSSGRPAAVSASWASRRWSTSAAASERPSCWTAASAPTCRPTRPMACTPTVCGCAITPAATSTACSRAKAMMPIDKDAIAQFIGWMGELTMTNPLFNWKLYDRHRRSVRRNELTIRFVDAGWIERGAGAGALEGLPGISASAFSTTWRANENDLRRQGVVAVFRNDIVKNEGQVSRGRPADLR